MVEDVPYGRVVNEGVLRFTHDTEIDWMLPGVAPTGKYVEVPISKARKRSSAPADRPTP